MVGSNHSIRDPKHSLLYVLVTKELCRSKFFFHVVLFTHINLSPTSKQYFTGLCPIQRKTEIPVPGVVDL